jgi:ribosomal protein S18 acetylase RimI-like enzyme
MRRLEKVHERSFALKLAGDPRTAQAHFSIEVGGAGVWRTSDSRCHVVVPPNGLGDVHIIGTGEVSELMELLRGLPLGTNVTMSGSCYSRMAHLADRRRVVTVEVYSAPERMRPLRVPPPRPDFDVRTVLWSDAAKWRALPPDAGMLSRGYGGIQEVLARGVAFGAFNLTHLVSLATAELGRTYAIVWAYTIHQLRGRGLATHCVAGLMDHLGPTGLRPVFLVRAENGSPERSMARRFGLEQMGELVSIKRGDMAL